MSNRSRFPLATALAVVSVTQALTAPGVRAQVGHDPAHSPYHDLRATQQFTFSGGFLGGSGGSVGVAPRGGFLGGARYSIAVSSSLELHLGLYAANLDRHLLDPTLPVDQRSAGTVKQAVMMPDGGFNLRLTGAKTWHGFMPYTGFSLGVASGSAVLRDNSGYRFRTPFHWGPHLGVRWYGRSALSFWVEGWDPMWRVRYPDTFYIGTTPVLSAASDPSREWVHNPVLLVGFALILRR